MRTQFLYVGVLGMLAGGLSAGCDDIHAGQSSDPSGPVMLVRLMVQDAEPFGIRGLATDVLDTPGSPLSTAVSCDPDLNPCLPQFVLPGGNPDFSCTKGLCNDPLAPTPGGVAIGIPETPDPGQVGGSQIRFVFNKILNSSFETVTIDPTKLPGTEKTYKLAPGIMELDGPDGKAVAPGATYWDPTGSPANTSNPIRTPFGPALVFKPGNYLAPNVTYTVKLTSSMVTDRKGNPMADQNGQVVSGTYTKTFKTENLSAQASISSVDVEGMGATITPDEVIQIGFNSGIDETTVMCDVAKGGTPVTVEAYSDRGAKPTMTDCGNNQDDLILDIASVSAPGVPADWAEGDYTIHCTGKDDQYGMGSFDVTGTFTVMGPKVASDPLSVTKHVLPEQCI
ncbi:MAG: hypothetical protein JWN44_3040 [Myxococcales bacterium]|nr:hypothetical protein [Myxococcales bacterium]